jgi:hypothetical protein
MPPTAVDAYKMAKAYFDEWLPAIDRALRTVELQVGEGGDDPKWRKEAAFTLHQAAERSYACFLLARTFYSPLCRARHKGLYAERQTMPMAIGFGPSVRRLGGFCAA